MKNENPFIIFFNQTNVVQFSTYISTRYLPKILQPVVHFGFPLRHRNYLSERYGVICYKRHKLGNVTQTCSQTKTGSYNLLKRYSKRIIDLHSTFLIQNINNNVHVCSFLLKTNVLHSAPTAMKYPVIHKRPNLLRRTVGETRVLNIRRDRNHENGGRPGTQLW